MTYAPQYTLTFKDNNDGTFTFRSDDFPLFKETVFYEKSADYNIQSLLEKYMHDYIKEYKRPLPEPLTQAEVTNIHKGENLGYCLINTNYGRD